MPLQPDPARLGRRRRRDFPLSDLRCPRVRADWRSAPRTFLCPGPGSASRSSVAELPLGFRPRCEFRLIIVDHLVRIAIDQESVIARSHQELVESRTRHDVSDGAAQTGDLSVADRIDSRLGGEPPREYQRRPPCSRSRPIRLVAGCRRRDQRPGSCSGSGPPHRQPSQPGSRKQQGPTPLGRPPCL